MSRTDYHDEKNMEISIKKPGKIESDNKKDNSKRNNEPTITKGKERNIRYNHLDMGLYTVTITADNM
jgi:hypothetical protein